MVSTPLGEYSVLTLISASIVAVLLFLYLTNPKFIQESKVNDKCRKCAPSVSKMIWAAIGVFVVGGLIGFVYVKSSMGSRSLF